MFSCPGCGYPVPYGFKFCGNCGTALNWPKQPQMQSTQAYQQQQSGQLGQQSVSIQNTSGQGKSAVIPYEIKEWNWGAFIFAWIWGVCNSVWISLLCLIPVVATIMVFVLGAKGNEWAWQSKEWDSTEHFRRTQRTWRNWAIAWAIFVLVLNFILIFVLAVGQFLGKVSVP